MLPLNLRNGFLLRLALSLTFVLPVCESAFSDDGSDSTLAVVNGKAITEADLEFLYLSRDVREELRPTVRDRYIEQLIDRTLLKEFLTSRKITAPKRIVDERVERVEKLITREGLEFDQVLKELGYTRESFRAEVALPLSWLEHARLAITDKTIAEYWKAHRSHFDGTEVRAAHIVKRLPAEAAETEIEQAKGALSEVRQAITEKKLTFSEAAAEHSDSPTASDGGDLGQFPYRGRMSTHFTKVAFDLQPGEVSEPFRTPFGIHLLTVTEIIPGDLSLEDARGEIFQHLSQTVQDRLITELRSKATISVQSEE